MTNCSELKYDTLPGVMPFYTRALAASFRRMPSDPVIPALTACVSGVTADAQRLSRYRQVCAFRDSGVLPITYPHVLAFPLHMALMTARRFPLKLAGLVHVRNRIIQHRPIGADETLDLIVRVGDQREVARGIEFDLITEASDSGGHIVWEEVGTMLSRRRKPGAGSTRSPPQADDSAVPDGAATRWHVDAATGRRYAAVAGDYNPIHLSAASARLFGFSRAIATGMWLKARVAAELVDDVDASALTLALTFEKPVFLPSVVELCHSCDAHGTAFALVSTDRKIRHLQGDVSYVSV